MSTIDINIRFCIVYTQRKYKTNTEDIYIAGVFPLAIISNLKSIKETIKLVLRILGWYPKLTFYQTLMYVPMAYPTSIKAIPTILVYIITILYQTKAE